MIGQSPMLGATPMGPGGRLSFSNHQDPHNDPFTTSNEDPLRESDFHGDEEAEHHHDERIWTQGSREKHFSEFLKIFRNFSNFSQNFAEFLRNGL